MSTIFFIARRAVRGRVSTDGTFNYSWQVALPRLVPHAAAYHGIPDQTGREKCVTDAMVRSSHRHDELHHQVTDTCPAVPYNLL